MLRRIVECVPNFSEGRDAGKVEQIVESISRYRDIAILGVTLDPDHNRSVVTFAGPPESVLEAAVRAVAKAGELIDLNTHSGVHPRIGATDVLPFVPVSGVTMEHCVALAIDAGERIWSTLGIPVYFYEYAARVPSRRRLENIRRGQFEELRKLAETDEDRRPDIGGPTLHATAGATVVGAREFLIAYNINLATEDIEVAKRIARKIRESSGGFRNVKALGLPLTTRKQSQVSMNLTNFRATPLHVVQEAVREAAEQHGVRIAGSEIIGLIPKAALEMAADYYLKFENFTPAIVLENRLEEALPITVEDVLDEVANPRTAGGPGAAVLAGSMAASLGSHASRLTGIAPDAFEDHRTFFRGAGAAAAWRLTEPLPQDAILQAAEASLAIAERGALLQTDLDRLAAQAPAEHQPDITTARGLASAARYGALSAVELSISQITATDFKESLSHRASKLK